MRKSVVLTMLCASLTTFAAEAQPQSQQQLQQESHAPGIELPEGEGRTLLLAACTRCHDLRGLPAYKGYWDSGRWRGMIDAMVKNGAPLRPEQAIVLADYLALHFGKPATSMLNPTTE